jgi:hypothetical protein
MARPEMDGSRFFSAGTAICPDRWMKNPSRATMTAPAFPLAILEKAPSISGALRASRGSNRALEFSAAARMLLASSRPFDRLGIGR